MKLKQTAVAVFLLLSLGFSSVGQAYNYWWGYDGWGWGWGSPVGYWAYEAHAIASARIAYAQARYAESIAAQEYARARAYLQLSHALTLDLRRMNTKKWYLDRARRNLSKRVTTLNAINMGKVTPAVRSSLVWFSTLPGFETLEIAKMQVGPFGPEQFTAPAVIRRYIDKKIVEIPVTIEGFGGGSLTEFLAWLNMKQFGVVPSTGPKGPTAWQTLLKTAAAIREQAVLTDQALEEKQYKDTDAVLRVWGDNLWNAYGNVLPGYVGQLNQINNLPNGNGGGNGMGGGQNNLPAPRPGPRNR